MRLPIAFRIATGLVLSASATVAQTPEKVQHGVISSDRNETFPAIDPADGSLWFSVYGGSFDAQTLMRAPRSGDGWGEPAVAPMSGQFGDRAPRFSPDGSKLFFTSNRPASPGAPGEMHVWLSTRTPTGWSEPARLPAPVNIEGARDIHPSVTRSAVWVASTRPGGQGRSDIYRVPMRGGGWGAAEPAAAINDEHSQPDLLVDPDERWIIFAVTDHPDGLGGDDLFIIQREGEGWGAPRHLPAPINSAEYEYGPTLSPDGRTLYFTSHRDGSADVWRIPVSALGIRAR